MKTGSGLLLIGAGAILAFAVTATPSWLNLHTAGWVLIVIGIAGIMIPKRGYGWIGRRLFVRRYEKRRDGPVQQVTYPPYVTRTKENTKVPPGLPSGGGDRIPQRVPGETQVTEDIYEE